MSQIDDFLNGKSSDQQPVDDIDSFLNEKPKRTWGEAIKDTGAQLAEGVNTTIGAIPNLVAPDSKAAGFFRDNAENWRDKQSEPLKQRIAASDEKIRKAGEDGLVSQIGEAASEYWNDPAQAARLVATNIPSMIPGLGAGKLAQGAAIAKGASLAKQASIATGTAAAVNAAMNAGGARGEAFDDLQRSHIAQGATPEAAREAALSESLLPAAVGGVAGAVSGKIGLEKALLGQVGAGSAVRGALRSAGAEIAGEQVEEVAPKIATNLQVGRIDAERGALDDVGRTVVETAIGAGPGAIAAGGFEAARTPGKPAAIAPPAQSAGAQAFAAGQPMTPPADIKSVVEKAQFVRDWQTAAAASMTTAPGAAGQGDAVTPSGDVLPEVPGGMAGVQRTFDPRTGGKPPISMLQTDAGGNAIDFEASPEFDRSPREFQPLKENEPTRALGFNPLAGTPRVFPDGTVSLGSDQDEFTKFIPSRATQIKRSEQMGLNPAAGPLSAAAVTAVDTGAHQEIALNEANAADQAAYEQATNARAQQAAEQDTTDKPITHGPIAEAAMSAEDKQAILFSNKAVADGGIQYAGTKDGDILNGLGKPYPTWQTAMRRAKMEGKDWSIAPVFDGFVARRTEAASDVKPAAAQKSQQQTDQLAPSAGPASNGQNSGPDQSLLGGAQSLPGISQAAPAMAGDLSVGSSGNTTTTAPSSQAAQPANDSASNKAPALVAPAQVATETIAPVIAAAPTKQPFAKKDDLDHLFGVDQKRAKAIERIAKGTAYFGQPLKAQEFIAKSGLKDTHQSVKTARGWDVVAKDSQPKGNTSGTQTPQAQQAAPQGQAAQPAPANLKPPRGILAKKAEADAARAARTPNGQTIQPATEAATDAGAVAPPAVRSAGVSGVDEQGAVPALSGANDVIVTPELDAVHAAATSPLNNLPEPTDAQKKAGNYKVGKIRMSGLDISIENPQVSERRGVDADGKEWVTPMRDHYGYFRGTTAADGDKLDVFIKPGTPQDYDGSVFVVDQVDPKTGKFDEHKVVFGAADQAEAEEIYRRNYSADWNGLANITALPMPAFKAWAGSKATRKPLGAITEQSNVQNTQSRPAGAETKAAPVEAPAPARGDATQAAGIPAATGAGDVQADGVKQPRGVLAKLAEQKAKAVRRKSEDIRDSRWESMNLSERERVAEAIGRKGIFAQKLAEKRWDRIDAEVKTKLREVLDVQNPPAVPAVPAGNDSAAQPKSETAAKAPPAEPVKPEPAPQPKAEKPASKSEFKVDRTFLPPPTEEELADGARYIIGSNGAGERIEYPGAASDATQADGAFMGSKRKPKAQGTPTDRAVMDMAGEGKSADEILRFIANASKSPFNRQMANLLRRTGANPAVSIGGEMGGGAGFKFLAKYSRKNHEVTLSEGASGKAEQILLHEMVHAATLLALDRGGEHAARMKALYESVKAQGLSDAYGMKNVGEFVAEAFTNPDFQKLLKGYKAPGGTAWDRFVAAVRRILGLSDKSQDALSAALELGVEVMRENMQLRKARSFLAEDAPAFAGSMNSMPENQAPGPQGDSTNKNAPTSDKSGAFAGLPQGGMQERAVRAVTGSPEPAQSVFEAGSGTKITTVPPSVVKSALEMANKEAESLAEFDVQEELRSIQENGGGADLAEIAQNPEFWDAEDEVFTQAGLDEIDRINEQIARERAGASAAETLEDLNGAHQFAQVEAMESILDGLGLSFKRSYSFSTSRYIEVDTKSGETFKLRFANHANTAKGQPKPDVNVAPDAESFMDAIEAVLNLANDQSAPVSGGASDDAFFGMADAVQQIKQFDVKTAPKNTWAHYRGMAMQALGRRQIVDLYAEELPQLEHYNDLVQRMDAEKNDSGAEADRLAQDWGKLKNGEDRALAELMHDATLAQMDPSKAQEPGTLTIQYKALEARYKALTPEAKALFAKARDMYKAHYTAVQKAIKERIERSEMSDGQKRQIMARMDEELFKELKGVYFPLARFGQYVIVVKDANGEVKNVTRAETVKEAEAARKELQKAFPAHMGNTVGKVLKQAEFNAGRDAVGKGFMADLMGALDKNGIDDELRDTVAQLYLSSLPDLSWAKHGIHRKGTPGFSQDARRAFAQNMFHGARYLAKLRYADQLQDQLTAMQDHIKAYESVEEYDSVEAQQVVDEMVKRHEFMMNPKSSPVSTALTSFGFLFHMGLSPASAAVNLTQTALVAFPQMGAKWGFGKASSALIKASEEVVRAKNDLSKALKGDELEALNQAIKDGTIDVTMAHDLAGISQGEDQGVMWKVRPVMRAASFMFHHAEKFNRQATFLAAYRLAKSTPDGATKPFRQLYEEAQKATYDGHFDYGTTNRPRMMQGNWQRVILLFKTFAQNMIYTLSRNAYQSIKAIDPKERTQARKALAGMLATHAAAAGVLGLPIVGPLLTVASFFGSDDDEPWDAEVAMQNAMAEMLGPKAAEVMARGLSRLTPFDLSGRVALDKLILPDVYEGLEGKAWAESAMAAALGPVAGIGVNVARGMQKITDGDYMRGIEDMLPTALRGPIKAMRYAQEGAVDKTGIVITDEVSAAGILGQAAGLSPSQVRRDTERRSAIYSYDKALTDRRSVLMRMFADAQMNGDTETVQDVRQDIAAFNEKNPNRRITVPNLMQSVRNRQRRIDQAQEGIYLPKNRRDALDAVTF